MVVMVVTQQILSEKDVPRYLQVKDNFQRSSGNSMKEDKMLRGKRTSKRHCILTA